MQLMMILDDHRCFRCNRPILPGEPLVQTSPVKSYHLKNHCPTMPTEGQEKRKEEAMTERDVQNAPIRWKIQGAGFVMEGGFVVLVDQDPDPFPCTAYNCPEDGRDAHEDACRETWATALGLEGDTLEEAKQALAESRFRGAAYHLSDCQLLEDRPTEDATRQP